MKHLIGLLVPLGALILLDTSMGQEQSMLLHTYKEAIQNYMMTGYGKGWKQCDILSDRFSIEGTPHVSVELDKIETLDTKTTFASSHCLLVTYHVASKASLSTLLDFGWATIKHLRLALVMKMDSGISLGMAINVTKLPFLVAAESDHGKRQFLCPVIGEMEPRLELDMCKPSYVSYKYRSLRVGIMGLKPYFINTELGHDGIDFRMLTMLEERLKFKARIIVPPSFLASVDMSDNRETEISLSRWDYLSTYFVHNDFIGPLDTYDFHFISAAPQEISGFLALIRVFDLPSWTLLLISVVAVSITLVAINHWSNMSSKENVYQSVIFCIGAVIDEAQGHQQTHNYITTHSHSKARLTIHSHSKARLMLVCAWMLAGFFLTISYKSVLRAMMMTIEYDQTIDSIDDMLMSEMPAVMMVDTSLKFLLETDPREKVQVLAKKVVGYQFGNSKPKWVDEGIVNRKHVEIGPGPKTDFYLKCVGEQFGKCHASKDKLWWKLQPFVVPKGSPLHRDFNMAISWWIATGTYQKMKSDVRNIYSKQAYWIPQSMQEVPLEIYHVLLSFFVLGFGLVLSKFVFFGEHLYNLYRKQNVKKSVSFTQVKEKKTAIEIERERETLGNVSENSRNLVVGDFESRPYQPFEVRGEEKKPTAPATVPGDARGNKRGTLH